MTHRLVLVLLAASTRVVAAQPASAPTTPVTSPTPPSTAGAPAPTAPAANDEATARARTLYLEGKRHYDLGEYAKSIEIWKRAYVISSAPMLLFNIAQAYRLAGDCTTALKIYASYERESPDMPNQDELERAKTRCIREPTNANPPGEVPGTTPPTTITTEPSSPAPATLEALNEPAAPTRIDAPARGGTLRVAGIATAATGGVLVITSLVLARRASNIATELEGYRGEWTTAQHARDADGRSARTWSLVTGIGGAAALIGGGALYFIGRRRDAAPSVTVSVGSQHAEVSWSTSF
jgi:hypothetical protein